MGSIILDPEPLDFFYLPPSLVGREKETKMLEAMYSSLPGTGGMHTFVTGESGLGETALVKIFFEKLKEKQRDENRSCKIRHAGRAEQRPVSPIVH